MLNSSKISLLPLLLACSLAYSGRLKPESAYQKDYAEKIGGETEVVAPDGTRCDILTETHAIEVDFGDKWGEAIGQSLNYGFQFNRKAGIVLILESKEDYKYLLRVNSIVMHYKLPIDVWEVKAYEGEGAATPAPKMDGRFWISSTGKTHRAGCRYFGKGKGRASNSPSKDNCKICGGAN
tara:strand:+ start:73 stop:612 length:540 start_codon:yes stop_codon:yes gene_type:complete